MQGLCKDILKERNRVNLKWIQTVLTCIFYWSAIDTPNKMYRSTKKQCWAWTNRLHCRLPWRQESKNIWDYKKKARAWVKGKAWVLWPSISIFLFMGVIFISICFGITWKKLWKNCYIEAFLFSGADISPCLLRFKYKTWFCTLVE